MTYDDMSYQEYVLKTMLHANEEAQMAFGEQVAELKAQIHDLSEQAMALREAISDYRYRRESISIVTGTDLAALRPSRQRGTDGDRH